MKHDLRKTPKQGAVRRIREGEILRMMQKMVNEAGGRRKAANCIGDAAFTESVASQSSCKEGGMAASPSKAADQILPTTETETAVIKKTVSDLGLRPWTPDFLTAGDNQPIQKSLTDANLQAAVRNSKATKSVRSPITKIASSSTLLSPTLSIRVSPELPHSIRKSVHGSSQNLRNVPRGGSGSLRKLVEKSRSEQPGGKLRGTVSRMTYGTRLRQALKGNQQASNIKVNQLSVSEKTGRTIITMAENDDFQFFSKTHYQLSGLITEKLNVTTGEVARRQAVIYEYDQNMLQLITINQSLLSMHNTQLKCVSSEQHDRADIVKDECKVWGELKQNQSTNHGVSKQKYTSRILKENALAVRDRRAVEKVPASFERVMKFFEIGRERIREEEEHSFQRTSLMMVAINQKSRWDTITQRLMHTMYSSLRVQSDTIVGEQMVRTALYTYQDECLAAAHDATLSRLSFIEEYDTSVLTLINDEQFSRGTLLLHKDESGQRTSYLHSFLNDRRSYLQDFLLTIESLQRQQLKADESLTSCKATWALQHAEIKQRASIQSDFNGVSTKEVFRLIMSEGNHRNIMEQVELVEFEKLCRKAISMGSLVCNWTISMYVKMNYSYNGERQLQARCQNLIDVESAARRSLNRSQESCFNSILNLSVTDFMVVTSLMTEYRKGAELIRHQESSRKLILINWLQISMEETAYRQHLQTTFLRSHVSNCFRHLRAVKRREIIEDECTNRRTILICFSLLGSETSSRKVTEMLQGRRYTVLRLKELSAKESSEREKLARCWYADCVSILLNWMFSGNYLTLNQSEGKSRSQIQRETSTSFAAIRKQHTTSFIIANSASEERFRAQILHEEGSCRITIQIMKLFKFEHLFRNWIERHAISARMRLPRIGVAGAKTAVEESPNGVTAQYVKPYSFIDPTSLTYNSNLQSSHYSFWGVGGTPSTS